MSLSIQWLTLGMMLLAGAGMGVLFDSYRIVSGELKFPRWTVSVLDIVYWISSAIIVFQLLYESNYGEVRAYVFIGLALGAAFYALLLSSLISKLVLWLISITRAIIQFIVRVYQITIVKPVLLLGALIIGIVKFGAKCTIVFLKFMLQLILPIVKLLLWLLKPLYKPFDKHVQKLYLKWVKPIIQKWTFIPAIKKKVSKWVSRLNAWIFG